MNSVAFDISFSLPSSRLPPSPASVLVDPLLRIRASSSMGGARRAAGREELLL
jgi:hypothetical protein